MVCKMYDEYLTVVHSFDYRMCGCAGISSEKDRKGGKEGMKAVLKVAKKALPSASIYFGIFCALMFAFTFFAGKDQEKNFQATELNIYVYDSDDSALSRALI